MLRPKKQIAALPWRAKKGRIEILLITSRETKRWVIPKGWPMDGLKDYSAARREADEEAGVVGHMKRAPIGTYRYDKRLNDGSLQPCNVHVFALEVTEKRRTWKEKGQRTRSWFAVDDAIWHVDEDGLKDIIRTFAPH